MPVKFVGDEEQYFLLQDLSNALNRLNVVYRKNCTNKKASKTLLKNYLLLDEIRKELYPILKEGEFYVSSEEQSGVS